MKTWKQKQKRKKAREKEKIKVYWDRYKHCKHRLSGVAGLSEAFDECYVIYDDKNKRYFMDCIGKTSFGKVKYTHSLKLAARESALGVNIFIEKFGHTGAWRPIRVIEKKRSC